MTTAVKIQEKEGYNVTIVADTFPSDPKSIRYTSLWAVSTNCVAGMKLRLNGNPLGSASR